MANTLIRRDQFNITPQGIVHNPTDAAFTPYPVDHFSGTMHLGQLGNVLPSGEDYRPDEVQRIMMELWAKSQGNGVARRGCEGITGVICRLARMSMKALASYALSPIRAAGSEPASNGSAQIRSLVCPGESINSTGLPKASTSA